MQKQYNSFPVSNTMFPNVATVFLNSRATKNVGDNLSTPFYYFPFSNVVRKNLEDVSEEDRGKVIIVGGGGLVEHTPVWTKALRNIPDLSSISVCWGVGSNRHDCHTAQYESLSGFNLVGCRDWGSPFMWVPCASCMHQCFNEHLEDKPSEEFFVYSHFQHPLSFPGVDSRTNIGNFADIISCMAKAEVVITNSYHGVYWATLLGKRVVVVEQFSSRFLFFKHKPVFSTKSTAISDSSRAIAYPNALEECRNANRQFYKVVCNKLLHIS